MVTIPCCVVIFLVGLLGFVVSGSWLLQTNFFMLLINNVYGSVAQLCTLLGLQGGWLLWCSISNLQATEPFARHNVCKEAVHLGSIVYCTGLWASVAAVLRDLI